MTLNLFLLVLVGVLNYIRRSDITMFVIKHLAINDFLLKKDYPKSKPELLRRQKDISRKVMVENHHDCDK